jgi:hypothetical protein
MDPTVKFRVTVFLFLCEKLAGRRDYVDTAKKREEKTHRCCMTAVS